MAETNENVLNIDPSIDLKQCLLWQYNNSQALRDLLNSKENWYAANQQAFWQNWYDNVFNIDTANNFGLSVWGQILNFSRNVVDKNGVLRYLTTNQYRLVLKGQMTKFGMGASAYDINRWLSVVFANQLQAYCIDTYDMTAIPFVFRSVPNEEISYLLGNIDFFPRPAGVGYQVRILPNTVFGFNGSNLQPFNQGVFQNDYSEILTPIEADSFQFSINAPAGATAYINGEAKNYAILEDGTDYTWSVERDGYISAQGSGTVEGSDISIDISAFTVNNVSGVGTVFINNQTAVGAYFVTGSNFNYSYSVGASGYIPVAGSGVATQDFSLSVSGLTISASPSGATVVLNGQTAIGALFVTNTIFDYSYTVSLEKYQTQTGAGTTSTNSYVTVTLTPLQYSYSKTDILSPNLADRVNTLYEQAAPFDGNYTISLGGGAGYSAGSYGGISVVNGYISAGQTIKIVAMRGGFKSLKYYAGAGIGLYIGGNLVACCGGGGAIQCGGGGYVGGNYTGSGDEKGSSINGSTGGNTGFNQGAYGGRYYNAKFNAGYYAYGGSSYANTSLGYTISQTYGNGTTQGNSGGGYFTIKLNV